MGTKSRPRPKRLAEKIKLIGTNLGLSQNGLIDRLGLEEKLFSSTISQWERGEREPSYISLLAIAKLAGVCTDYLIDDSLDLPENLPTRRTHS